MTRLDRLLARLACRLLGHQWSWMLASGLGEKTPVCARCREPR